MEVGGEFVGDVSKESSAGQRYHSQGQSAIYPSDSQHCRFLIDSSVLAPSENDQFYKPQTRRQMPRCHAFGVLLAMCFVKSVRAQCGVSSVSVGCRAGQWLDIAKGTSIQCMTCTPMTCRLETSPPGGDTIANGTLSVVPTNGRLDNFDGDGSDHVVVGAMVY